MKKITLSSGNTVLLSSTFKDLLKHEWHQHTHESFCSLTDSSSNAYLNFCLYNWIKFNTKTAKAARKCKK